MKFRLWAQIGATLALNLALLGVLTGLMLRQQISGGMDSVLFAPARERIRDIGRLVENEFPDSAYAERTEWLAKIQESYGVTLAVYDDRGTLVAGPRLNVPDAVARELEGQAIEDQAPPWPGGRGRRGPPPDRPAPPMFLAKEDNASRYWMGYRFPIVMSPGHPPARHTLVVVGPAFLGVPLIVNWAPWIWGFSTAMLVSVLCWIPLVRRVTRSIHTVQLASAEIAEGRFETPIPVSGHDELADLAHSVRRMAEQLSLLIHGQRRFLADVAHELCAPLSRIQLSTGILAQRTAAGEAEGIRRLERDVAKMSALVSDLLSFTKGTVRKPELVPVALAELVDRVIAQEGADVTLRMQADLAAVADPEYLERAVGNLVRNAVRYAGSFGLIQIRSESSGEKVRLLVEDCGPGLPEGDLDAVFSPFYRPDTVRTPGAGGAGLGLAIVKGCVEACAGTVACRNRLPSGLEVAIELRAVSCTEL